MKRKAFTGALAAIVAVILSSSFLVPTREVFGLDTYSIYLNDKLLIEQQVTRSLTLKSLQLTSKNVNDYLTIRYRECHAPESGPKNRSVSLRDDKGNVVKEWRFKDGEKNNAAMKIAVKEVLQAQTHAAGDLVIFYSSEGVGSGQGLVKL